MYYLLLVTFLVVLTTLPLAHAAGGEAPFSIHNKNIQSHVQHWMQDPDATARRYGPIKTWDLRNVTSLRNLFAFNEEFNEDISQWNVAGVTDFSSMFWEANSFDQNLGAWDVSKAENMKCMFCGATDYKGDGLEQWSDRLHNVKDMYNMFEGSGLEADIGDWNVSNVLTLREMFRDTPRFKQKLCWEINPLAVATDMFNDTSACFDPDCVTEEVAAAAGCSGAFTNGLIAAGALASLLVAVLL